MKSSIIQRITIETKVPPAIIQRDGPDTSELPDILYMRRVIATPSVASYQNRTGTYTGWRWVTCLTIPLTTYS